MRLPDKAVQPTFYFIGVTTGQSAIMRIFPRWAELLGLKNSVIKGIDIELDADPQIYRDVVRFIKEDEQSMGALVTTHKLNVYKSASDLFDEMDFYAKAFEELSCISKKNGRLAGHAKDPISSGLAVDAFMAPNLWRKRGEAFIMGAGGSAIAIASYLIKEDHGLNVPTKIYVSDPSQERLRHMAAILSRINTASVPFEYVHLQQLRDNDRIIDALPPHSLVVNATGLGKDRPGSPLTDAALFPEFSLVWELNYRGDLLFKRQAENQRASRKLDIHDGWIYFIHGWTQVMAEVFQISLQKKDMKRLIKAAEE